MKCARCGEAVEQDGVVEQDDEDFRRGDPAWVADGCYVCEWYTGHDSDGRFAPTHEIDFDRMRRYDIKYNIHSDAHDDECPDCREYFRRRKRHDDEQFVVDFFRAKLAYEKDDALDLAKALLDNL